MASPSTESTLGVAPWTEEERRELDALLDVLIPANADESKPSARDVAFFDYMLRERVADELVVGFRIFLLEYGHAGERHFSARDATEQTAAVSLWERRQALFFRSFMKHLLHCYYQDPRVVRAIGMEARPPFPEGYTIIDGDLTLLEPVFERGRVYR